MINRFLGELQTHTLATTNKNYRNFDKFFHLLEDSKLSTRGYSQIHNHQMQLEFRPIILTFSYQIN